MAEEWQLASTNGYSRLAATLVGDEGSSLVHELRLESRLPGEAGGSFVAAQMVLSRRSLVELVDTLRPWLAQPLGALAADTLEASAELAAEDSDSLRVSFGSADDLVLTAGQVACRAELRRGFLHGQLVFATDPTCLQLLVVGLESLVATLP
jgi:hypothetical protein